MASTSKLPIKVTGTSIDTDGQVVVTFELDRSHPGFLLWTWKGWLRALRGYRLTFWPYALAHWLKWTWQLYFTGRYDLDDAVEVGDS